MILIQSTCTLISSLHMAFCLHHVYVLPIPFKTPKKKQSSNIKKPFFLLPKKKSPHPTVKPKSRTDDFVDLSKHRVTRVDEAMSKWDLMLSGHASLTRGVVGVSFFSIHQSVLSSGFFWGEHKTLGFFCNKNSLWSKFQVVLNMGWALHMYL